MKVTMILKGRSFFKIALSVLNEAKKAQIPTTIKPLKILEKRTQRKNGVQHTLYAILPQAQHKTAHSGNVMQQLKEALRFDIYFR